jgi:FdhD protein
MAGIAMLAAVGATTDLAVDTASRLGMTLVGFLRSGRCNVYTRPDRLGLET